LREVQARPALGPREHVPVCGLEGEPFTGTPPELHVGQGKSALPVTKVCELSAMFRLATPVVRFTVPVTGAVNVLKMHEEMPAAFSGSGVPKRQPVFEHSKSGVLVACPLMLQLAPVHASAMRFVKPSGVTFSATMLLPPPILRPPHVMVDSGVPVPAVLLKVWPQTPPPAVLVKSSLVGLAVVVVVVDVVVTTVEEEVDVLVDDVDDDVELLVEVVMVVVDAGCAVDDEVEDDVVVTVDELELVVVPS
jgi:hypothetical protein